MPWVPSQGDRFNRCAANPLLNAMETADDAACADPLAGAREMLQVVDAERAPRSIVTHGLPLDASWRKRTPASYRALAAEARADLVPLVAECSGGFLHIEGLRVDEAMVKAFPLLGARHVVLTACRGAVDEEFRSFAVAFAARSGTRVWAPLTLVRDDSARKADLALESWISRPREPVRAAFSCHKSSSASAFRASLPRALESVPQSSHSPRGPPRFQPRSSSESWSAGQRFVSALCFRISMRTGPIR